MAAASTSKEAVNVSNVADDYQEDCIFAPISKLEVIY